MDEAEALEDDAERAGIVDIITLMMRIQIDVDSRRPGVGRVRAGRDRRADLEMEECPDQNVL